MEKEYRTYGRHVTVDCYGVSFELLNSLKQLSKLCTEGAEKAGATVLSVVEKQFEPQGTSVLLLLSESHLSVHTYPEKGFCGLDCYTCGEDVDPQVAIDYIVDRLNPTKTIFRKYDRGVGTITEVVTYDCEKTDQ